ncbi:MAG: hypothetical protein AB4368_09130 [Xenococcaceae cyanobacterium]
MVLRSKTCQPGAFIFRAIALKKRALHRRGMIRGAGIEARLMIREEKFTTYYLLLTTYYLLLTTCYLFSTIPL